MHLHWSRLLPLLKLSLQSKRRNLKLPLNLMF